MTVATERDYKYVLEDYIGRGMFSQTQKAEIAGLHQGVIVKTLGSSLHNAPEYPQFKQHFQSLAARLAKIEHPHLPAVVDLFEEENYPFIIYKAIAGENLEQILATTGKFSEAQALAIIEPIVAAVSTLHAADLLHLDIQPRHLIQCPDSEKVVLVEFGLTHELNSSIRQTHANLLAPGYAAPEQHDPQGTCTVASDIYALCATFYALLTGDPPPPAPVRSHISDADGLQWPQSVSAPVKTAITAGLALDPQQRPQTLAAWQALLTATPTTPEKAPTPAPSTEQTPIAKIKSPAKVRRLDDFPVTNLKKNQRRSPAKFPVSTFVTTCLVAASAGVGFGLSVRFNRPDEAGSTLWHQNQSFPPREVESPKD